MTCDHVRVTLRTWDPSTDLSDPVVGHLDRCGACRARFDDRFPPCVDAAGVPAAPRLAPARKLPAPALAAVAAAAVLLTALPGVWRAPRSLAAADPPVCQVEPWIPPECPTT